MIILFERFGIKCPTNSWTTKLANCNAFASVLLLVAALFATPGYASDLPTFTPTQVAPPAHASYVLPDGSIQILGSHEMEGIFQRLNDLYKSTHSETKFASDFRGDNTTASSGLACSTSAFAPMTAEYTPVALVAYKFLIGGDPLAIRIAHASLQRSATVSPIAVVVNKNNPLDSLTMSQLYRIFGTGNPGGDITHWGQVGLKGDLARISIRPYGLPETSYFPSEDPEFGHYMSLGKMNETPFTPSYVAERKYDDVIKRVSAAPDAIGFVALNRVTPEVKVVALSTNAWGTRTTGTTEEIGSGVYPLDRYIYIYVRIPPGKPIDPFVREYIRMALSNEGQKAIAGDSKGYIPLNAREVAEELAKLY